MPYQNEHAARIIDPAKFDPDSFRRKEIAAGVNIIIGKLKGETTMTAQAYRFDNAKFTPDEAKKWLKDNNIKNISFEPSMEEKSIDMTTLISRSFYDCAKIEVRSIAEKNTNTLTGYVFEWDALSVPFPGTELRETVKRGAVDKSLKEISIKALWNHNKDMVLGNTKNGTLRLIQDERGLKFDIDLPGTSWGRDAGISVARGDVDTMSFSFFPRKNGVNWTRSNNISVRELVDIELLEVSPCPFAAYPQSSVYARSLLEDYENHLQIVNEEILKNISILDAKKEIINRLERTNI